MFSKGFTSRVTHIADFFRDCPELLIAIGTTLFIATNYAEPFTVPKLTLVVLALSLWIAWARQILIPRWTLLCGSLLGLDLIITHRSWARSIFGSSAGHEGALFYGAMLVIAGVASSREMGRDRAVKILGAIEISSVAVAVISLLQKGGIDPTGIFTRSDPISLVGNTDYVASIVGLGGIAALCLMLFFSRYPEWRALHLIVLSFLLYVSIHIGPFQGLVTQAVSVAALLLFALYRWRRKFFYLAFPLVVAASSYVGAGFFGIGPLGVKLQQISMMVRTFLWRDAILMWWKNPFFGVGIDGYADNFRKYRDARIVDAFSLRLAGDNPHNLILQSLATLGILGLMFLLIPIFFALRNAISALRASTVDLGKLSLFVLFLNALLFMMISPGVITNAIWFWILCGSLIGRRYSFELISPGLFNLLKLGIAGGVAAVAIYGALPPLRIYQASQLIVPSPQSSAADKRIALYAKALANPFATEADFLNAASDTIGLEHFERAQTFLRNGVARFPENFELRKGLWQMDQLLHAKDAQIKDLKVLHAIDPREPRWSKARK